MGNRDLTAQWYNALVQNCNLDPHTFQLIQGAQPVGNTSSTIWKIMDAIPPESIDQTYDGSGRNVFSTNYGAILGSLDSGNSLVDEGQKMWDESGGFTTTKVYDTSIGILKSSIASAASFSFTMDSHKQSSNISGAWARGKETGKDLLFENDSSGRLSALMEKSGIVVNVKIDHLMKVITVPLSTKNTLDQDLSQYEPWYISALLNLAYFKKDVWKHPDEWEIYFGEEGTMLRSCISLIIVDGISTETIIDAPSVDKDLIVEALGKKGVFPLINLSEEATVTPTTNAGRSAVDINSPQGNELILGVNVAPLFGT